MIHYKDDGNNFPNLCRDTLKYIELKGKSIDSLDTDGLLLLNGESIRDDFHEGIWLTNTLKNIHSNVIILVDDAAFGFGESSQYQHNGSEIYILTPELKRQPTFGNRQQTTLYNWLLMHMTEINNVDNNIDIFRNHKYFLRQKHFLSYNRETKKQREFLYNFIKVRDDLMDKFYYSYTKHEDKIYLDGIESWGRNSVYEPPKINLSLSLQSYINVVTTPREDDHGNIFFDEKIWKPILSLQPFMLFGCSGQLKKLKEFGFETFSHFINEEYDEETNDKRRYTLLCKEIERLSNLSLEELHNFVYSEKTMNILEHNFEQAMDINNRQKENLKNLIEELTNG